MTLAASFVLTMCLAYLVGAYTETTAGNSEKIHGTVVMILIVTIVVVIVRGAIG